MVSAKLYLNASLSMFIELMPEDIDYAFFGNVVRGNHALFRLIVRNGPESFCA